MRDLFKYPRFFGKKGCWYYNISRFRYLQYIYINIYISFFLNCQKLKLKYTDLNSFVNVSDLFNDLFYSLSFFSVWVFFLFSRHSLIFTLLWACLVHRLKLSPRSLLQSRGVTAFVWFAHQITVEAGGRRALEFSSCMCVCDLCVWVCGTVYNSRICKKLKIKKLW